MQKTKQIQINGNNYELIEMPATKRSIIGLQIKDIVSGSKEGIKDFNSEINLTKIVFGMLGRVEPEKGAYLLRDIVMTGLQFPVMTSYEHYDDFFSEKYEDQIELVAEIMEFNFGKVIESVKKKLMTSGILALISSNQEEKT